MEQNLSDRERRIRLALGMVLEAAAAFVYFRGGRPLLAGAMALLGLGFVVNYFTCFCATKRLLKSAFGEK